MQVSLHRRQPITLPPRREQRSSPSTLAIILAGLTAATVTFAASRNDEPIDDSADPIIVAAEQASRDVVDERIRAHLRRLR